MSSPSHPNKRKRLKSPDQVSSSNSSINVSPISDDETEIRIIPFIHVEDISESDEESTLDAKQEPGPAHSDNLHSPAMKLGLLCSAGYNMSNMTQTKLNFQPIKRFKFVTSKTTISIADSPGQSQWTSPNENPLTKSSIGSPKCMVQEVSSTVDLPSMTPKRSFQEVSSTVDIQPTVQKQILFTSLDSNTKERLRLMISKLGGAIYLEITNFTDECTHIILGKPNTGEKYLGGLMCGKWLLRTEYIEESYAQGCWLDEESFEWNSDNNYSRNSSPIQQPDKQDLGKLGAAARRCRLLYAHQRPFHDWVAVILCMHPKRQDCYERLFKYGGGRVINISDYTSRYAELTHVFIGNSDQTLLPECLKKPPQSVLPRSIPILKINYLHAYVIEEIHPNIEEFKVRIEAPKQKLAQLPEAKWRPSYWRDCKRTDTVSVQSTEQVSEFVRSLFEAGNIDEDSHSVVRQITLPLLVGCIPSPDILKTLVSSTLLPGVVVKTTRECMSVLGMIRWSVPPINKNRYHYIKMLGVVPPNSAEFFGELLMDAVKEKSEREWPQSPLYVVWWADLLEEDFSLWQKQASGKPIIECLFSAWHSSSRLLKTLITALTTILPDINIQRKLVMGLMSILTVLYTSCEIKDLVSKNKLKSKNIATEQITATLAGSLTNYVLRRDMSTVRKFVTLLGASNTLIMKVVSKALSNMNQMSVPHQYKFLAQKSVSWEKLFRYQFHLQPRSVRTDYQPSDATGESPPKWVQRRNVKGETAFHVACRAGEVDKIKTLLSFKIPINDTDHAGWTGLHEACNSAQYEVVKEVIDHCTNDPDEQIDFSLQSVEGTTLLHEAVKGGDKRIVLLMLVSGAGISLDTKDNAGRIPIECTDEDEIKEMIEKFIHEGSDVPQTRKTFNSKDVEILLLLLSTMFRVLLKKCQPPSTLQPSHEITSLKYRLSLTPLTSTSEMLLSLMKAGIK